jgi:Curli assembly protein CsgE
MNMGMKLRRVQVRAQLRVLMLGTVLGLCLSGAHAQSESALPAAVADSGLVNTEYGGLVTAEVLTSMGHLFHAKFTEFWQNKEDIENFHVLVKERPYRRGSTEVQVVYDSKIVYRRNLPSNFSVILQMATEAVESAHREILNLNFQTQLFRDVDMAPSGY